MQIPNIGRYDLNLLRALHALIDLRHVSQAADRCGMSQPAMSRTLARLRLDFGDPLLIRAGGGLRLTPRAEELLEPLQTALGQLGRLYQGSAFEPGSAERIFRVAIPDALAASLFAPLVSALAQEAPRCRFEIIPWHRFRQPALASLDFAVSTEFELFPGFRATPLFNDHDVVVVRSDRAKALATASTEQMLSAPHVAVVAIGSARDPVDKWLSEIGHSRNIKAVVPHYLQALLLVSQSELSAILPSRLTARYADALGLTGFELPAEQYPDRIHLFHPAERDADPANRWLRNLVRRTVCN
jgi:DNA-binding transcriptional LysR family regulator